MRLFNHTLRIILILAAVLGGGAYYIHEHHNMSDQLRYTALPLFNPHRTNFTCVHQDTVVPPIDPQADAWFEEGKVLTSDNKYENEKDYVKAAELWAKAAKLKHWKAQNNLAGLYLLGNGVVRDPEKALTLTEEAMAWGVPQAWDNMGSYHNQGIGGLKPDATVAYAFWQKAADMGSPLAQGYLGEKLVASYDNPKEGFWANETIGFKMLECSFAQGNGRAAYDLGVDYKTIKDDPRSLYYYHEGVKSGSMESASALTAAFDGQMDGGRPAPFIDKARAERYRVFRDALHNNSDLRFPNLDKVLPLPPAKLPQWDGNPESLIDAAKPIRPAAPKPISKASQNKGRYYLAPELRFTGYYKDYQWNDGGLHPYTQSRGVAPHDGYWVPNIPTSHHDSVIRSLQAMQPGFYKQCEKFDEVPNLFNAAYGCPGTTWRCVEVERVASNSSPRVSAGLEREVVLPTPAVLCKAGETCTQSGYWIAFLAKDHPHHALYRHNYPHQAYVAEGEVFAVPRDAKLLGIKSEDVQWRLAELSEAERVYGIG